MRPDRDPAWENGQEAAVHAGSYGLTPADGQAQPAGSQVPGGAWPVWAGLVPPLADGFITRPETAPGLEAALIPGAGSPGAACWPTPSAWPPSGRSCPAGLHRPAGQDARRGGHLLAGRLVRRGHRLPAACHHLSRHRPPPSAGRHHRQIAEHAHGQPGRTPCLAGRSPGREPRIVSAARSGGDLAAGARRADGRRT